MRTLGCSLLRPPGGTLHLLVNPEDTEHSQALPMDTLLPQSCSHATQTSTPTAPQALPFSGKDRVWACAPALEAFKPASLSGSCSHMPCPS